ncbi:hypothetical protein [Methanogenium cariaci]|jgi:hypothetical protein
MVCIAPPSEIWRDEIAQLLRHHFHERGFPQVVRQSEDEVTDQVLITKDTEKMDGEIRGIPFRK